jgi:ABC-type cobalamin/Fe3+-siderophores transport system ATPase subunit
MHFFNQNIPSALLDQTRTEEDISILIGENGSGKSTLLNELAQRYMASQYFKVIAIANTIHDKFRDKEGRLNSLKVSEGKGIVKKTLVRCLAIAAQDEMKRFTSMGLTLRYVGFNCCIKRWVSICLPRNGRV